MDEGQYLQQMMLGKLNFHLPKNKIRPKYNALHKDSTKCFKELDVKPEALKLLEENRQYILQNLGTGKNFLNRILFAQKLRQLTNRI